MRKKISQRKTWLWVGCGLFGAATGQTGQWYWLIGAAICALLAIKSD
jgi:hypothetical protein